MAAALDAARGCPHPPRRRHLRHARARERGESNLDSVPGLMMPASPFLSGSHGSRGWPLRAQALHACRTGRQRSSSRTDDGRVARLHHDHGCPGEGGARPSDPTLPSIDGPLGEGRCGPEAEWNGRRTLTTCRSKCPAPGADLPWSRADCGERTQGERKHTCLDAGGGDPRSGRADAVRRGSARKSHVLVAHACACRGPRRAPAF
jgi:hypothetical protein